MTDQRIYAWLEEEIGEASPSSSWTRACIKGWMFDGYEEIDCLVTREGHSETRLKLEPDDEIYLLLRRLRNRMKNSRRCRWNRLQIHFVKGGDCSARFFFDRAALNKPFMRADATPQKALNGK